MYIHFKIYIKLRQIYIHPVGAQDQYVFIHDALKDYISCGDTSVVAYKLKMVIDDMSKEEGGQSGFERQFKVPSHNTTNVANTYTAQ